MTSDIPSQQFQVQVAQSLPISNTGSVMLLIKPAGGTSDPSATIVVGVNQSAMLVPGDYDVVPRIVATLPTAPIARISYDRNLQQFDVKVLTDRIPAAAQFSVLVNLSHLIPNTN